MSTVDIATVLILYVLDSYLHVALDRFFSKTFSLFGKEHLREKERGNWESRMEGKDVALGLKEVKTMEAHLEGVVINTKFFMPKMGVHKRE